MLIPEEMLKQLLSEDPPLGAAHQLLLEKGYKFIGYHGTNLSGLRSLVPSGFDSKYIGTGEGTARGQGFYVSYQHNIARDYAYSASTQFSDMGTASRRPGEKGHPRILRIYAKRFDSMQLGEDYRWGLQNTASTDKNGMYGDLSIWGTQGQKTDNTHDLELIFCASVYPELIAIPSPSITAGTERILLKGEIELNEAGVQMELAIESELGRAEWRSYSIDGEIELLLKNPQPQWCPPEMLPVSLKRESSDPSALSRMSKWISTKDRVALVPSASINVMQAQLTMKSPVQRLAQIPVQFTAEEPEQFTENSPEENYQQGLKYYHGTGVATDMLQAKLHFLRAARQQHAGAQYLLGDIYEHGRVNGLKDPKRAKNYYVKSANQGNAQGCFAMGTCYEHGVGTESNLYKAERYYRRAKLNGNEGYSDYYNEFLAKHAELQQAPRGLRSSSPTYRPRRAIKPPHPSLLAQPRSAKWSTNSRRLIATPPRRKSKANPAPISKPSNVENETCIAPVSFSRSFPSNSRQRPILLSRPFSRKGRANRLLLPTLTPTSGKVKVNTPQ
jgi:hypothetical protein